MLTATFGDSDVSFAQSLNTKIKSNVEAVNNPSADWLQFVQDHKAYVRERSTAVTLTETDLVKYQYRVRRYLSETYGSTYAELTFRVINNLSDDMDFNMNLVGETVYIPSVSTINEMRNSYVTGLSMAKKL